MTPEQLAKSDTEAAHQTALFCWASLHRFKYPELEWMHHIPNGGSRGGDARSAGIAGARLKAQGVKAGVADVFLPVRRGAYSGLYIEFKKPALRPKKPGTKGGCSDEQLAFRDFVTVQGFGWVVCYTWEDAVGVIERYLLHV